MSIQKRGRRYRVRFYEGGKQRSRTFLTKSDAQQFDYQVKLRKSQGELLSVEGGRTTLQEFGVNWFDNVVTPHKAEATARGYADLWDAHILPELGDYKLRELTPEHIQAWITRLSQRTGPASLRKSVVVLQGCLKTAVQWRYLASNPVRAVEKPPVPRRKRVVDPLDPVTVEAIRSVLLAEGAGRDATLVSILAYAGLRPQEALALRWADIESDYILVERAAAFGKLKETKTGGSRTVRLLPPLAADLAEWKLAQGKPQPTSFVFPRRDGRLWDLGDYRRWRERIYNPAARRAGVEKPRPYDLRHGFASLLLREGVNPVEIAEELGHSLATLLKDYSHVIRRYRGKPRQTAEDTIREARLPKICPAEGETKESNQQEKPILQVL